MLATARSHHVEEVLDPSYVPATPDDIALFKEKQTFMYSVLLHCLQTDMGKSIVRGHDKDGDAQKVYDEWISYSTTSTKAQIAVADIMSYVTSVKLDSSWCGTVQGFIVHWKNQVRILEDLGTKDDQFSNSQKHRMLENAVDGIDDLRQVKQVAQHQSSLPGATPITFDSYCTLLLSAAATYDKKFAPLHSSCTKRTVFAHDFYDGGEDPNDQFSDPVMDGLIDEDLHSLEFHLHDHDHGRTQN